MNLPVDVVKRLSQWLIARSKDVNHRQILLLSVAHDEGEALAEHIVSHEKANELLWVGRRSSAKPFIHYQQYKNYLGREYACVVYNTSPILHINALMALSGTIRAGGLLVLIAPQWDQWALQLNTLPQQSYGVGDDESRFALILQASLLSDPTTARVTRHGNSAPTLHLPITTRLETQSRPHHLTTEARLSAIFRPSQEQEILAQKVFQFFQQHTTCCATLTAHRGRGKTWLLGYIAALQLKTGLSIAVIAPQSASVKALFAHTDAVSKEREGLQFLAPDSPLITQNHYDVVIVDEAASIPVPQLKKILSQHTRFILSTTLDGYEGSGLGFTQRVLPLLSSLVSKHVLHEHLVEPMRWYDNDPIENLWQKFISRRVDSDSAVGKPEDASFSTLRGDALTQHSHWVDSAFQLLQLAHYQTTPQDLVRLYDAHDSVVFILTSENNLLGAAVGIIEGGEALSDVADDIAKGARRVHGHLSAQQMALATANPSVAMLNFLRINRIAITPMLQQQGLGSLLLDHIYRWCEKQRIDVISSVFGSSTSLKAFWRKNAFSIRTLSGKANKASGLVNELCYRTLNANSAELLVDAAQQSAETALRKAQDFIHGHRSYSQVSSALNLLAAQHWFDSITPKDDLQAVILPALQHAKLPEQLHPANFHIIASSPKTASSTPIAKEQMSATKQQIYKALQALVRFALTENQR
ncbi:GNAT family N-acetyltransferase [Alteromonas oceanisediminis]|uniref:GNAT family N-acetyltransferase n=1 Tax=Alteromonas oceanisediminis TaxID=2836180 RepID=UPI001BD982F9|nr:GNAT family N-acetyltransferase [Alteromonas oceanisediminis]MBT0584850.1 GNAT family N-acetyltransferase [Alteromonas oceanisediminis]